MATTQEYTPITQFVKEVVMDAPGDYSAFVNSQYLGSRRTRAEAEELCDSYTYELLTRQPEVSHAA